MPIKKGDAVKVHYKGCLADGTVFDSSEGREPFGFIQGEGQVIPGFEAALLGHESGDSFTVTIPAEQAYGTYDNKKVFVGDRSQFPPDAELKPGRMITVDLEGIGIVEVMIVQADDDKVIIDANHPLSGEELTFEISVVSVN